MTINEEISTIAPSLYQAFSLENKKRERERIDRCRG